MSSDRYLRPFQYPGSRLLQSEYSLVQLYREYHKEIYEPYTVERPPQLRRNGWEMP